MRLSNGIPFAVLSKGFQLRERERERGSEDTHMKARRLIMEEGRRMRRIKRRIRRMGRRRRMRRRMKRMRKKRTMNIDGNDEDEANEEEKDNEE